LSYVLAPLGKPEIAVIHLVWKPLGVDIFSTFLQSYRSRPSGIEHELVVLLKGFASEDEVAPFNERLAGTPHHALRLPDEGFDIGPYFAAARAVQFNYLCFLNSYSRVLGDEWLAKLHMQLTRSGVSLVGATGSYESHLDAHRRHLAEVRYPRGIRGIGARFRDRRVTRRLERDFDSFPNPHIRTNGFMVERTTFLGLHFDGEQDKMDSHRFESGKHGMTRQLLAAGAEILVVGRDGIGYPHEEWALSRTFRSGEQENLLIADNRTDQYAEADEGFRALLASLAWAG
jgi:hypothetical protein